MGKRGPQKGVKYRKTLEKAAAAEVARQLITAELRPIIEAQLAHAKGLKYLVVRDKKTGKFVRVSEGIARVKLAEGEELVEVWEKDPSVLAFCELLNRALGKVSEKLDVDVRVDLGALIAEGRQRALARNTRSV